MILQGFTLAELLITLGIIGIIAALTLPAIIGHYKKQEIASKLKKFSSTIQNAFTMASAQYGDMSNWDYPNKQNNAEQINEFVSTYLYPFLTGIKECKAGDKTCQKLLELINGETGSGGSYTINTAYVFMDGGCFSVLTGGTTQNSLMMHITYDYNCEKKPNKFDKDVFAFIIRINKASNTYKFKAGSARTFSLTKRNDLLEACKKHEQTHYQGGCSALIEFDGWEIKDDYPWLH